MAKQLNVALDFSANTTQAKQQIQELQQLLTKLAYGTDLGIDPSKMKEASEAAKQLAVHLNEAYNQKTGNYDLSKFSASLNKANTDVTKLSAKLLEAGTTGQQAFVKLAQSIAAADQPVITLNARLQDFLTTMKNTVKWQISSSMIHSIQGALQGAYGYAQDLNQSLNDIRIVTGHNIDYMDKFAEKANKAAKALSTTTLDYTDASLIFYQQGLSDDQVEERTAITLKMANAAGESAQKISDQLTAIWNNFDDGSVSLEHYADAMLRLGADTASSTDEISEGVEKFAAVAGTIGLSFDNAAAALATITDKTRQSADVVGTALKTIFARVQGLNLGETLDDGTTLNKYSAALESVGINIKDSTGQLKDMDIILDEMGTKWQTLNKDEQVALAQTVAGVRQWTQLVSLMDNYDFYKDLVQKAKDSTGTLEEQSQIYEESWKAANKRLKASFEGLYQNLIDDKFFIKFTDFLADTVSGADAFIEKLGGIKPLLMSLLSFAATALSSKIQPALDNIVNNIKIAAGGANQVYGKIRKETNDQIESITNNGTITNPVQIQELKNVAQLNIAKQKLADQNDRLSDSERRLAEITIQGFEMQQQEILDTIKNIQSYQNEIKELQDAIQDGGIKYTNTRSRKAEATVKSYTKQNDIAIDASTSQTEVDGLVEASQNLVDRVFDVEVAVDGAVKRIGAAVMQAGQTGQEIAISGAQAFEDTLVSINEVQAKIPQVISDSSVQSQTLTKGIKQEIDVLLQSLPEVVKNSNKVKTALEGVKNASPTQLTKKIEELKAALREVEINGQNIKKVLNGFGVNAKDIDLIVEGYKKLAQKQEEVKKKQQDLNDQVNKFNPQHLQKFTETFLRISGAIGQVVMAFNSFKSAFDNLSNPELSGWEKFSSLMLGLSFALPQAYNAVRILASEYTRLKTVQEAHQKVLLTEQAATRGISASKVAHAATSILQADAEKVHTGEMIKEDLQQKLVNFGLSKSIAVKVADAAATGGLSAALKVLNAALKKAWLSLAPFIGVALAVTAAIAAIGFGIYTLIKRSKAFETECKQSSEDLQTLKDNLNDVNQEVENVTSSLDELSSKYDTFKDLKYGTVEWREALYDINDEVQGLIDKYDDLKEGVDYYRDSLGALHLTESGEAKIREQALEKQNKAQTAVRAQEGRDNELKRQTKIDEIVADAQHIEIGTKKVAQYQTTKGHTQRLIGYKTEKDYASLSEDSVNKVVQAVINNPDFDWSQESLTEIAGLDERTAKLITANGETQKALEDLTTETIKLKDSYESEILNELLARGLNLSGYDEKYRNGIGNAIASDVNEQEQAIIASRNQEGNKLTENEILTLLENQGIAISSLSENWFDDLTTGNDTITAKKKDEETGYASDEEITIDYDTLLKNFAAEAALEWGLGQQDNYFDEQKYSQQAYDTADSLKPSWDAQNFNSDVINTEVNERNGSQVLGETKRVQDFLNENSESFSDMFGLSEEDFKNWAGDINNVKENFGELQKAIEGDSGAINNLRDDMGSLGTHGQELVDKLGGAWDKCSDKVKAFSEWMTTGASDASKKYSAENEAAFDEFVSQNSEVLSDLAGISQATFEKLYKEDKRYARKVAKLMPDVAKGNQKALTELNIATQRSFYTTGEQVNQVLQNIANSGRDDLKAAFGDSLSSVQSEINTCFTQIQEAANGLQLDPEFDTTQAISSLNTLISAFGFTAEQAQAFVASMGFSAEIDSEPTEVTSHEEALVYTNNLDEHGHHLDPPEVVPIDSTTMVNVPTVKTLDWEGKSYGGKTIDNTVTPTTTGDTGGDSNGGGGNSYTPPPPKEYKDEIERYHVIKQKIEDLEEVMDHLAKAKDRAFGTSKLELMDQEIEKYGEMIDLQNQYLDEINQYWEEDRALIASYGAQFDDTGVITNYDELMKNAIDKYNASIGKNEDADDAAEEAYDDFIEALEQYEETNNLRQDELEKLYDLQTELADVIFEKTTYKIEIKIAVKDDELEYLDYLLSKIEDDAYAAAEAIALLGAKTENALAKTKIYSEGLAEILKNHGVESIDDLANMSEQQLKDLNFTEDEIDTIREYKSAILEANQELLEMRNNVLEKVMDSFDKFSEDMQDQIDLFEHYQSILESVKDITSLLNVQLGKQAQDVVRNINRSLMNNSINNLAATKKSVQGLEEMQAQYKELRDQAIAEGNSEAVKKYEEGLKQIEEKVNDAEEDFLSAWQEALELAREIFETEMDNIVQDFARGISPIYGTIDALQDAISKADEVTNQYLSATDKTYELNKLRRQIEGSIDDTDNIAHKQELYKLQENINKKLKDGTKISEYDLKVMQAQYELALARQNLEDNQNANAKVQLTRDNEGNWGYVYSADEDKVAEAEQEYEDKLNAMQKLNSEYIDTLQNNILQLQSDYQEQLQNIFNQYVNGEITESEYKARLASLETWYKNRMDEIYLEYEKVFANTKDTTDEFRTYYKDTSNEIVDSFEKTTLAAVGSYESVNEMYKRFWESHNNYMSNANQLLDDYLKKQDEIGKAAGALTGQFADAASGWSIKITGKSDEALADMDTIVKNATESFKEVIDAASKWENSYGDMIDSAIKKNEELVKTMQKMIATLSGLDSIDYSKFEAAIDSRSTATANNIISTQRNSLTFNGDKQKSVSVYTMDTSSLSQVYPSDLIDDYYNQIDWEKAMNINVNDTLLGELDIESILQSIGLNVQTIVNQLSNLIPAALGIDRIAQDLLQHIEINADFPNVTDSQEILEAFNTMENEASQYANRKTI